MSRVLFVMLHPGFIRYYEDALHALADAGHQVHVAFEVSRTKLGEDVTAERLAASSPRITCGITSERPESVREFLARGDRSATRSGAFRRVGTARERTEEAWESLATTIRLLLDYLRFFEPAFAGADKLRARAEKRLPRVYLSFVRIVVRSGATARSACAAALRFIERVIPTSGALDAFVREHKPDLLLVTPLIELGSQQVDYVKCAKKLGIRSALCVASWDNLTSKGLVRVVPDHVVVWNEAQKTEAVELHGVPPDRVAVTGAQLFDRWFEGRPSRTREEFCRMVGIDPERPFVLYVGSSMFIAPDEVPFTSRWISRLRRSSDPSVAGVGVLVRPHPSNSRQWRTFTAASFGNAGLWPPIGTDPNAPDFRRDYFDSIYYSEAVVGINTSAQIESAILSRPVFTVQTAEFAHAQEGTLHFRHLMREGAVQSAASLDEHVEQLRVLLSNARPNGDANREFVRSFVRPHGLDVPVAPIFAKTIGEIQALGSPVPVLDTWSVVLARPLVLLMAHAARTLAEDRPLWVYPVRPVITAAVWLSAFAYRVRSSWRTSAHAGAKRTRRAAWRAWYETTRSAGKRIRRMNKPLVRFARQAGGAAKRAVRRETS